MNNNRAQGMGITTVIMIVVAAMVLLVIISFFLGGFGSTGGEVTTTATETTGTLQEKGISTKLVESLGKVTPTPPSTTTYYCCATTGWTTTPCPDLSPAESSATTCGDCNLKCGTGYTANPATGSAAVCQCTPT